MAGLVKINRLSARKPSDAVRPHDRIELEAGDKYVGRGGHKLEHALNHFRLKVEGSVAVDLGASTGGFVDCLLQQGAKKVFAVDVGHGQLAWKLRRDPRVSVMDRTNASDLTPARFPQPFQPADLIYISATSWSRPHWSRCMGRIRHRPRSISATSWSRPH